MPTETSAETAHDAGRAVADIEAAIAGGDWRRAYDASSRAISRGLRHPIFFMVRAQRMEETARFQSALEDYQRAAEIEPQDARIHDAIGICAMKLDEFERAADAFASACALEPARADIHYRRGLALAQHGAYEAARDAYQEAVRLAPQFIDAIAGLASIAARLGETACARQLAVDALALDPRQVVSAITLVQADMSDRLYAEAEEKARVLLDRDDIPDGARPVVLGLLGDVLDGQRRYAEAFAAHARENETLRRLYAPRFSGNPGADAARNLVGYFENAQADRWKAPDNGGSVDGAAAGHVFLLGFMRSGTTLLEQVIACNPNVVALDEKSLLAGPSERFLTSVPALDALAQLDGPELLRQRRHYWENARRHTPDLTGKTFVDKQPLNTSKLPLIAKLFPRARILFALRDPRDVVLSCFRRHLKVTPTQFEFLSLEDCARFYSAIMRLYEVCREKLVLNLFEHRYEEMVQDFDGRVRAVCDFIGVEWAETMRNFDTHVSVADLRSPSARQIRRPLYGEGIGQWRHYSEQMKPVFPLLEPWVDKFGYPRD